MNKSSRIIFKFGAALIVVATVLIGIGYFTNMLNLEQVQTSAIQVLGTLLLITIGSWLLSIITSSH